jgi:tyrosyl-tRNA synthetase
LQQSTPLNEIVEEYTIENARVITKVISLINLGVIERRATQGNQFIQTFNLTKGLQNYGEKGKQAAMKEIQQLHERKVFEPISVDALTYMERKRA